MATEVLKTVRAAGGDYGSLSAFEAGEQRNLVAVDQIAVAECFNDWPAGLVDSVTINGWTTDATRYIEIRTPQAERHTGVLKDGASYTGFTLKPGANRGLDVRVAYTRVIGIAFDMDGNMGVQAVIINGSFDGCWFNYNLVKDGAVGISFTTTAASINDGVAVNNIIYDAVYGINSAVSGVGTTKDNMLIYNNTCVGCSVGIDVRELAGGSITNAKMRNNLCSGNVNDYNLNTWTSGASENNASSDDTADDVGGSNNRINQVVSFVDAAADDYHLADDDTGAIGYGLDLSADPTYPFNDDIDGDTRYDPWDIGADQHPGGGGADITRRPIGWERRARRRTGVKNCGVN